jgi:3'-5' exoribonuclease
VSQIVDLAGVRPGHRIDGVFVLTRKDQKLTKKAPPRPYLNIEVRNESGSISGNVWTEMLPAFEGVPVGSAVRVAGFVKEGFNGGPAELDVKEVEAIPGPHPVLDSMNPRCSTPLAELEVRWQALLGRIVRPGYRLFVQRYFEIACPLDAFFRAPAAVNHHHNYLHGLLEHTLEVTELALMTASLPALAGKVDTDVLIVGGLIHDSGKVEEYEWEGVPIRSSNLGRGTHHIALGVAHTQIVRRIAGDELRAAGLSDADIDHLCHIQQSHHGMPEWGSYYEPRSVEAIVFHQADMMSAKARGALDSLAAGVPEEGGWVGGMRLYYRGLYAPALGTANVMPAASGVPATPVVKDVTNGTLDLLADLLGE